MSYYQVLNGFTGVTNPGLREQRHTLLTLAVLVCRGCILGSSAFFVPNPTGIHRRDLHRDLAGQRSELVGAGDEVRLTIHFHERANPSARVNIRFDDALSRLTGNAPSLQLVTPYCGRLAKLAPARSQFSNTLKVSFSRTGRSAVHANNAHARSAQGRIPPYAVQVEAAIILARYH